MRELVPHCPACGTSVFKNNPFLPFCSKRCQLIDWGRWVSGEYRLPGRKMDRTEEKEQED